MPSLKAIQAAKRKDRMREDALWARCFLESESVTRVTLTMESRRRFGGGWRDMFE